MDGLQVNPYNRYDQKLTVKAPKNRYAILSTMILRQESTPNRITAEGKWGKYQTPRVGQTQALLAGYFLDWSFIKSFLVGLETS